MQVQLPGRAAGTEPGKPQGKAGRASNYPAGGGSEVEALSEKKPAKGSSALHSPPPTSQPGRKPPFEQRGWPRVGPGFKGKAFVFNKD